MKHLVRVIKLSSMGTIDEEVVAYDTLEEATEHYNEKLIEVFDLEDISELEELCNDDGYLMEYIPDVKSDTEASIIKTIDGYMNHSGQVELLELHI